MFTYFTTTTKIYTLSLHDALPICAPGRCRPSCLRRHGLGPTARRGRSAGRNGHSRRRRARRSEEHTSELQSRQYLVCRLLLEKKKQKNGSSHIGATAKDYSNVVID